MKFNLNKYQFYTALLISTGCLVWLFWLIFMSEPEKKKSDIFDFEPVYEQWLIQRYK